MSAYSFINVYASLIGPGVSIQIGSSAGAAKEGISRTFDEDKNTTTTGADGTTMNSLHAGQTGIITVRLLKTSPINSALSQSYNFQRQSAANWGQNVIRVADKARGDVLTGRSLAYVKLPDNEWSEDGNILAWQFRGILNELLGAGIPDLTLV